MKNYLQLWCIFLFTKVCVQSEENVSIHVQRCSSSNLYEGENVEIPPHLSTTNATLRFKIHKELDATKDCKFGKLNKEWILNNAIDAIPKFKFTPDGSIVTNTNTSGMIPHSFCINRFTYEVIELEVCTVDCNNEKIACVPKCCPPSSQFDSDSFTCIHGNNFWDPIIHDDNSLEELSNNTQIILVLRPIVHFCTVSWEPTPIDHLCIINEHDESCHSEYKLLKSGKVMYKEAGLGNHPFEEYPRPVCIDYDAYTSSKVIIDLHDCTQPTHFGNYVGNYTSLEEIEEKSNFRYWVNLVHSILMIFSAIFLLIAAGIYIALWEKQNTHGWTVLSYILSLFFAYIFLSIYKLRSITMAPKWSFSCYWIGILAHFFFESVFTWLTVINFDIWWKFWDLKSKSTKMKDPMRYLLYAIFAYGLPFLIIFTGILIEHSGNPTLIKPSYGSGGICFLQKNAQGVYLYYPIGILIGANSLFFLSTSWKIYSHFKSTSTAHGDKEQQELESCKVIVKLFVVMGFTWIFEFIGFMVEHEKNDQAIGYSIIWSILDSANILQALGIFYVFIWKRIIYNQLTTKYPSLKPFLKPLKGLPGCRKRIDYRSSSRLTSRTTYNSDRSHIKQNSQKISGRKLSDSCETTLNTQLDAIELT